MDQGGDGNGMATLMLETLRTRLAASGDLSKIKSEMRAVIFNDLRDGEKAPMNVASGNSMSPTNIANHLIVEYLEWIGFQYSLDMFRTESGCVAVTSREIAGSKVGIEGDKELPLLLSVTMEMMKKKLQK